MIVYVAGPYRSRWGILGRCLNIYRAWRVARDWWKRGDTVICPHTNTAFMSESYLSQSCPDEMFIERQKWFIAHADLVVALPQWESSIGSCEEVACAKRLGKKILYLSLS